MKKTVDVLDKKSKICHSRSRKRVGNLFGVKSHFSLFGKLFLMPNISTYIDDIRKK